MSQESSQSYDSSQNASQYPSSATESDCYTQSDSSSAYANGFLDVYAVEAAGYASSQHTESIMGSYHTSQDSYDYGAQSSQSTESSGETVPECSQTTLIGANWWNTVQYDNEPAHHLNEYNINFDPEVYTQELSQTQNYQASQENHEQDNYSSQQSDYQPFGSGSDGNS